MTKANGVFRGTSSDPLQADQEAYRQLTEEGLPPDDLVFRFSCQQCGLRCCMASHVETVVFSPYSYAYIRHHVREEILDELFQLKVLEWVAQAGYAPVLKVGGIVCPFLSLHWDASAKATYQHNLELLAEEAPPEFQLLLVGILHTLTTLYYDSLRDSGVREVTIQLPVHQLITVFCAVWDRVTFDRPNLFPTGDLAQGEYLRDFYEFLRHPPDPVSSYQASCSIWLVRPQVCRVFPLARWVALKDESMNPHISEKVLLEKRVCPPIAFERPPLRTATQFLKEQQVEHREYVVFLKANQFFHRYADFLTELSPDQTQVFYKSFCQRLYSAVTYTSDVDAFYQQVHHHVDAFIADFEELYSQRH